MNRFILIVLSIALLIFLVLKTPGSNEKTSGKLNTIITTRVDSTVTIEYRNHSGAFIKELVYKNTQTTRILSDSIREEKKTSYGIKQNRKIAVVDERIHTYHRDLRETKGDPSTVDISGTVSVLSNGGDVVWEKKYGKPANNHARESQDVTWDLSINLAKEADYVLIAQGMNRPQKRNFAYLIDGTGAELFKLNRHMKSDVGIFQAVLSYHGDFVGFLLNEADGNELKRMNYFYHIPSGQEYYDFSGKKIWSIRDTGIVDYRDSSFKPVNSSIDLQKHLSL